MSQNRHFACASDAIIDSEMLLLNELRSSLGNLRSSSSFRRVSNDNTLQIFALRWSSYLGNIKIKLVTISAMEFDAKISRYDFRGKDKMIETHFEWQDWNTKTILSLKAKQFNAQKSSRQRNMISHTRNPPTNLLPKRKQTTHTVLNVIKTENAASVCRLSVDLGATHPKTVYNDEYAIITSKLTKLWNFSLEIFVRSLLSLRMPSL